MTTSDQTSPGDEQADATESSGFMTPSRRKTLAWSVPVITVAAAAPANASSAAAVCPVTTLNSNVGLWQFSPDSTSRTAAEFDQLPVIDYPNYTLPRYSDEYMNVWATDDSGSRVVIPSGTILVLYYWSSSDTRAHYLIGTPDSDIGGAQEYPLNTVTTNPYGTAALPANNPGGGSNVDPSNQGPSSIQFTTTQAVDALQLRLFFDASAMASGTNVYVGRLAVLDSNGQTCA